MLVVCFGMFMVVVREELWQCKLLIDAIDICMLLVLVNMHFPLRVVKVPRRQLEHPDDLLV